MFGPLATSTLVANWFHLHRGRALGVTAVGASVGGLIFPVVATRLMQEIGWRGATMAFAGVLLLFAVPLWRLIVNRPELIGETPDGGHSGEPNHSSADDARAAETTEGNPEIVPGIEDQSLLRSSNFWVITAIIGLAFCSTSTLIAHLVPYATDLGFEPQRAAVLMSAYAGAGAIGRLLCGYLVDRVDKRLASWIVFAVLTVGWGSLVVAPSYSGLLAASIGMGLGVGGIMPLWGALTGACFGRAIFGRAMGLMTPLMLPFNLAGAPIAAYAFDRTGSYTLVLSAFLGTFMLGAVVIAFLRIPRVEPGTRIALALSLSLMTIACGTVVPTEPVRRLEVATHAGRLVGSEADGVRRFLGIPFAAPPVGDLRFRVPRPPAPWIGVREATEFGPVCAQARVQAGAFEVEGNEDCLHLNVYTPTESLSRGEANLPVLVWIHGGGRRVGDGRRDVSEFVRDTQSIVVTIQYRLSHFAFFAHPALSVEDPERLASGNYGFLDAIAALRWVRNEIEAFGGDARRVTIAGLSGGGSMVCGLLASPRAAGLFGRAIIQSGSSCWFPTDPIEIAEARGVDNATALGCSDPADIATCLRKQSVSAFYAALGRMLNNPFSPGSTESFAAMPMLGARSGHQVDGDVFPRSWPEAFHAGVFHRVPVMLGVSQHEGRLTYGQLLYDMGGESVGAEDYRRALWGLTGSEAVARAAVARFPLTPGGPSAAEAFADVATDAHYHCPLGEMAQAISRFVPTYFYAYQVPGPQVSERIELGAYHGADTDTLFGDGYRESLRPFGPRQARAAKTLRAYVARFMRTGDPNGAGLPRWPALDVASGERHLAFDDAPHPASGLRASACEFWRDHEWEALPDF
jgi:para-nitrobenzyl esterase